MFQRMMSGKHLLLILSYSSALLSACVTNSFETPQMEAGEWLDINASAQFASTKVQMEDHGDVTSFAFLEGDAIGLYAEEGLFINEKLHCYDKVNGLFTGKATLFSHEARDQVKYYVYYPFIDDAGKIPTEIRGNLSSSQTAPFDARYDYLTASLVNRYDVDNFPNLAFTFGTHLFAIVILPILHPLHLLSLKRKTVKKCPFHSRNRQDRQSAVQQHTRCMPFFSLVNTVRKS